MEPKPNPTPLSSLGLYLGVAFLAFFSCLVLGRSYYDNDLIYQFVPFRIFLKNQLAQGHFPLWNPYLFGGQPFFANPNTMMCYPLTYLTLLFPIPYDLGVFFFIHMVLAAGGAHFWLKSLRLSENACRMGALAFALSGVFWWELIHLQILAAYALFPWLMGLLEGLFKEWSRPRAFLAGLCFALIFSCGGFQSTTCVFYTALVYFLFKLFNREANPGAPAGPLPWKKLAVALLFALWGALPLLVHLIPAQEFSQLTNRRDPGQTYENFNGTFSMVPSTVYQFLFPSMGLPEGQTIDQAIQNITDRVNVGNDFLADFGYIGAWAPLLFFFAFKRKDRRFPWFLLAVAALSILTAFGRYFPLHRALCSILPGLDLSRAPFRFIQTYVLFGSALLAYGFQSLERTLGEKGSPSGVLFPAAIYGALLVLAGLTRPALTWRELIALLLGLTGLALWGMTRTWKTLGRWAFQAALVLPLLLTGWGDFQTGPASNMDYRGNFPALTALRDDTAPGRYYMDSGLVYPVRKDTLAYGIPFPDNSMVAVGLRDIGGYSPILLKNYLEIRNLPMRTNFQLMALKGMLFSQDHGNIPDFNHRALGSLFFYEPKSRFEYLNTPYQFSAPPVGGEDLRVMSQPDFNPADQAVLEKPLDPGILSQLPGKKAALKYEWVKDEPDHQIFQVHLDLNSLVTFSDIAFPGWKASVDGKPSPILTADHSFRALFLPAGGHRVEFEYVPWWGKPLLGFLAAWCLTALLYAAFLYRSRKLPVLDAPQPQ